MKWTPIPPGAGNGQRAGAVVLSPFKLFCQELPSEKSIPAKCQGLTRAAAAPPDLRTPPCRKGPFLSFGNGAPWTHILKSEVGCEDRGKGE